MICGALTNLLCADKPICVACYSGRSSEGTLTAQGGRTWRISRHLCALHDSERHLGHVVKTDRWHAYDATHLNPQEDGIRYVGDFSDLEAAMLALEASLVSKREN